MFFLNFEKCFEGDPDHFRVASKMYLSVNFAISLDMSANFR